MARAPPAWEKPRVLKRPAVWLGAIVVIWGLNFTVLKKALTAVDPLVFNALRFTFATAFLAVLWRFERGRGQRAWAPWRILWALGLLGHVGYQVLFIEGLARTTSGSSALLIATSPLWTAVLASACLREPSGPRVWTGLALALVGSLLIALASGTVAAGLDAEGGAVFAGNALTLGAALAWAAYTIASRAWLRYASPLALAFGSMLLSTPLLWLIAAPELEGFDPLALEPWVWGAALYAGVGSIGLAYWLWNLLVQKVGATRTALASYLVPIVALVCGPLFLGEALAASQVAGGALILLGVMWARTGGRAALPEPPEA